VAGLVGVVTPHVGRWWFGEVVAGLDAVLRPAGLDMLLHPVPDAEARAAFFAGLAARRHLDAVVVVALPLTAAEAAALRATGLPVGSVGLLVPGLASVAIDEHAAARDVTDHLLDLGHRRIAIVGGDPNEPIGFPLARQRRLGYRYALSARGVEVDPALDVPGYWTLRGGVAAARRLLALPEPPTAVFAMSDEMAMGVLRELQVRGVDVPGQVSVAGFDNHPDAEVFGLTTMEQPAHDNAARLAAAVVRRLGRTDRSAEHYVNGHRRLVVRDTTGPAGPC
jgi:DNA-binding LacI/PurR family transcriptional regulator